MKITRQVCTLRQARILEQLGVSPTTPSTFQWAHVCLFDANGEIAGTQEGLFFVDRTDLTLVNDVHNSAYNSIDGDLVIKDGEYFNAFTAAELSIMLPPEANIFYFERFLCWHWQLVESQEEDYFIRSVLGKWLYRLRKWWIGLGKLKHPSQPRFDANAVWTVKKHWALEFDNAAEAMADCLIRLLEEKKISPDLCTKKVTEYAGEEA